MKVSVDKIAGAHFCSTVTVAFQWSVESKRHKKVLPDAVIVTNIYPIKYKVKPIIIILAVPALASEIIANMSVEM